MPDTFKGFEPAAYQFLVDLAANNERAWFQPRKGDYERLLKQPLEALCVALAEELEQRKLPLQADPVKSPFRIYRDVRFAKDKLPYKTNLGASFPWIGADESRHGGGYFHLSPEHTFAGGGMWHPEPSWLKSWRRLVDEEPARVHRAMDDPAFRKTFGLLDGDRLQRTPAGYPADHPEAELLKLKDVGFGRELTPDEGESRDLPVILADIYAAGRPLFELLASVEA
jgi:uncharacterized protein (TIGR02453 family)